MPETTTSTPKEEEELPLATAIRDYDAVTAEETSLDQGEEVEVVDDSDPEWWLVRRYFEEDDEEEEGYVPSDHLKLHVERAPRTTTPLPSLKIETAVALSSPVKSRGRFARMIRSAGAGGSAANGDKLDKLPTTMPEGFRQSTLAELLAQPEHRLSTAVRPVLDATGLRFTDLRKDAMSRLSTSPVMCTIALGLVDAINIPTPGEGTTILGRKLYVTVFDKKNMHGNVLTVSVGSTSDSDTTWRFGKRLGKMIPGAGNNDDHVLLLRTNRQDREMCVLFELVVVIEQPSLSGATIIEMACGWGTLPLYTLDGHALDGKTYDIRLSGGTPFDKEVPLAASTSGSPTKLWQMMRTTTSMPTLTVRVRKLGRTALASADKLPQEILCPLSTLALLAFAREHFYNLLLAESSTSDPVRGVVATPELSVFIKLLDHPDMLRAAVAQWELKLRGSKRAEKKSITVMAEKFAECALHHWPMLCIPDLPPYMASSTSDWAQSRKKMLADCAALKCFAQNPGVLAYEPFDVRELIVLGGGV